MTLRFWQGWPRDNRIIFQLLFFMFAISIGIMWVAYFVEPSPAIELQTINEAELKEIPVDQFNKGPFDLTIRGNNYVILQRQLGSLLSTSEVVAYSYLFAMAVFVIGMLSVISTLGRFYYLVGMGIFILFVTSLSPELVGVFGNYGKTFTAVIMALYGLASFWLFYFSTTASFAIRVTVFTIITALLWALIYFASATEKPFLFIATYSAEAGLIACGLFIVTVSHEIIASFVTIATQSPKQRKSLNHFLIITLIYIINLALAYSVRFGFLHWDLITIDLFLLLTISAVLGVWGIRQRQKVFEGVIDAEPYGVFAFLLMGTFAFTTIAMFLFNANDTALSAISDVIIFTHIGFGVIFLTYVFSNFAGMLAQNMQVYKVLYSPNSMPFFTARFAGLIATLALVFYNAWQVPAHNAVSGFYNELGDLYMKIDNTAIAQAYYDESRTFGFRGHHANYAMANIASSVFDNTQEQAFYAAASGSRPTQMSYLNWAQTYQSAGNNIQAILTLTEGLKKLDDHDAIDNTLGLLYAGAGLPDSATKYLSRTKSPANSLGLAALERLPVADTTLKSSNDPIMTANLLAFDNTIRRKTKISFQLPADTVLTLAQAAGISNFLINTRNDEDTTFVRKVISLARKPSNDGFKEALLLASAIALYNSGETKEAFTTLEEVTVGSEHQGKYNNMLTMWALENDEQQRALDYADYAVTQNYAPARLTNAVALTESRKIDEAIVEWDSLRNGSDTTTRALANNMYQALSIPPHLMTTLNDQALHAYTRYRLTVADSMAIFSLVDGLSNDDIKAKILLDLAQKCYDIDKPSATIKVLSRIEGLELTDQSFAQKMVALELLARVKMPGTRELIIKSQKDEPIDFKGKDKKYEIYFNALVAEAAGDSTNATKYYWWLGHANPYFEDGQIAAANYFRNKGQTAYDMLAEARLHHPSSIKIKKAYALEAARQGLETYAIGSLQELKTLISAKDYADLTNEVNNIISSRESRP